jgi:hypothetical protein
MKFWFGSAHANMIGFNFFQGSFSEGASVSGMFTGEYLNNDRFLSSRDNEITHVMVEFTGNSLVPTFTLTIKDLEVLSYDLNGGIPGDPDRGLFILMTSGTADGTIDYLRVPGGAVTTYGVRENCTPVSSCIPNIDESTVGFIVTEKILPAPVPLPAPVWLLGSGLIGLIRFRHRKSKSKPIPS